MCFFIFRARKVPSWNKRKIWAKSFISVNIKKFLILELESSISWNIRNSFGVDFFLFFGFFKLWLKSAPGSLITHCSCFMEYCWLWTGLVNMMFTWNLSKVSGQARVLPLHHKDSIMRLQLNRVGFFKLRASSEVSIPCWSWKWSVL